MAEALVDRAAVRRELLGEPQVTMGEVHRYLRDVRDGGARDPVFEDLIDRVLDTPKGGPRRMEPLENDTLLELLLCPACDMRLSARVCSPLHALLQDSPLQHPLLLPLMEKVVAEIRTAETKICPRCHVAIAQGECTHVTERWGQVWMSSTVWNDLQDAHAALADELGELQGTHDAFVEVVDEERREARRRRDQVFVTLDGLLRDAAWRGRSPGPGWADELRRRFRDDL